MEKPLGCFSSCSMSGVRRAVFHNEGAVVVFHSPRACCQVIDSNINTDIRTYFDTTNVNVPVLTSNLTDKEAIFGGEQSLRNCLRYAAEEYAPEYIVVANSCTAGVIGDDIDSICKEEENILGIKIFPFTCSGLMNGAFDTGVFEAAIRILEYYSKPQPKEKGLITLIGVMDTSKNMELAYLKKLLDGLGLKINCCYPGFAKVDEVKRILSSEAILLCSRYNMSNLSYRRIASYLHDKHGMKLIDLPDPIGYGPTMNWLEQLGNEMSLSKNIVKAVQEQEGKNLKEAVQKYRECFKGRKGLIYVYKRPSYLWSGEWYMEILADSGIEVKEIAFNEKFTGMEHQAFIDSFGFSKYVKLTERSEADFEKYDFVFAIWSNVNKSDRIVKIPYLNPLFGKAEIEQHLEMLKRKLIKRSHED